MPGLVPANLSIGLVISFALAIGYVAGRLHKPIAEGVDDVPRILATRQQPLHQANDDDRRSTSTRLAMVPASQPKTRTMRPGLTSYPIPEQAEPEVMPDKPRHIGSFIDPDGPMPAAKSGPRHLGSFQDPDDPWPATSEGPRYSIGAYIDPDL